MKKKFVLASLMLAFIMCIMPNVYAYDANSVQNEQDLKECVSKESVCTLGADIKEISKFIEINNKEVTIDLKDYKITRDDNIVLYIHDGGKLTLTGNGTIESNISANNKTPVYVKNNSTLNVKGNVKIENTENGYVIVGESSAINISENASVINSGENGSGISLNKENSALNISGGTIQTTGTSLNVFGTNPIVKITNGNITSTNGSALYQEATNSKTDISGGNLTSNNSVAIFSPTGNLDITGGTISGKIGVISVEGIVNVTGGTINASGTGSFGLTKNDKVPFGVAIVVNKIDESAQATIGGSAIINATNENPILAYGDENNKNNAIVVNAGVKFTGTDPKDVYLAKGLIVDENGKVVDSSSLKPENNPKNPNTSDSIIYSIIAIVISALGLTFVLRKLHNN